MILRRPKLSQGRVLCIILLLFVYLDGAAASYGDRLPEFQQCLELCKEANCDATPPTPIAFHLRLLLWTCPRECDYACQRITTRHRLISPPFDSPPIVQYHGKWPFIRLLGVQEPLSVLFSVLNFSAHWRGLSALKERVPPSYPLRRYYTLFGYFGLTSWVFSSIFHTRDFDITEKADYFAAGASVLYGLYFAPIRIFRLEKPQWAAVLSTWTTTCLLVYAAHVCYLTLWKWDYTYNMAFNVVLGIIQNVLWSWFSIRRYKKLKRTWAAWPGLIVAWIVVAMSLELLDFPPIIGLLDAHALWHAGTIGPTIWWYWFLVRDAEEDMRGERLKA